MGFPAKDRLGRQYGRLTVVGRVPKKGRATWICRCVCGAETHVFGYSLGNGNTKSCGCWSRELAAARHLSHGGSATRLYKVWQMMRDRCSNPRNKAYRWYGQKGISVCAEWLEFSVFQAWALRSGYQPGLTIERISPPLGYRPDNCEWIGDYILDTRKGAAHSCARRDGPENKKPAYLAGFFGCFFFTAGLCGVGGVASIRRSTEFASGEKRLGRRSGLLMLGCFRGD